jgi:arylsulfatase
LDKLKELGIDENTIVMYASDNGNEFLDWPDGGTSYFRGEKNSQWEGGYRIPAMIKWPGVVKPGTINNEICSLEDMVPTLMAAMGDPNIKEELLNGKQIGSSTYKVHLDGYNLLPALKNGGEWPRKEFIYWTDGGSVAALRYGNWKITFLRQDATGLHTWIEPFTELRAPMICNLRMDPFERAQDESIGYGNWYFKHMFVFAPAAAYVGQWMQSFKEFPPRMKPGSFSLDRVMEAVTSGGKSN